MSRIRCSPYQMHSTGAASTCLENGQLGALPATSLRSEFRSERSKHRFRARTERVKVLSRETPRGSVSHATGLPVNIQTSIHQKDSFLFAPSTLKPLQFSDHHLGRKETNTLIASKKQLSQLPCTARSSDCSARCSHRFWHRSPIVDAMMTQSETSGYRCLVAEVAGTCNSRIYEDEIQIIAVYYNHL